jgi:hypothetical protein
MKMPLHKYTRTKIPSVRLLRDKLYSRMSEATVCEIFRLRPGYAFYFPLEERGDYTLAVPIEVVSDIRDVEG